MPQASEKGTIAEAFKLHKAGETEKVIPLYYELLKTHPRDRRLYGNLGAILRSKGEYQDCAGLMVRGLNAIGDEVPELLNTLGNCLRDMGRDAEAYSCYKRALKVNCNYLDSEVSSYHCLQKLEKNTLAKLYLAYLIKKYGGDNDKIFPLVLGHEINVATDEGRPLKDFVTRWLTRLDEENTNTSDEKSLNQGLPAHWFHAAQACASRGMVKESLKFLGNANKSINKCISNNQTNFSIDEIRRLNHISSWNLGCTLLKYGEFETGWKLYDHGLLTPAEKPQRWQRSLYKPFSQEKVKMWRGEDLKNKKILLLGEQGIGDSMMFLTIVPALMSEGANITVVVPQRLVEIYKRSLPGCIFYSDREFKEKAIDHKQFDYQSPLGSIFQFRFKSVEEFKANCKSYLQSREEKVKELKNKYSPDKKPILGISWQGGGRGKRINDKSIQLNALVSAIDLSGFNVVSLQYGNDEKIIEKVRTKYGIKIIDDPNIQAIQDMESWIDQVDTCDLVLSIANTTIHGAGGLRKPTLCLLGDKPDWRWLDDNQETNSYWYPSVKIARKESEPLAWKNALIHANDWLHHYRSKLAS